MKNPPTAHFSHSSKWILNRLAVVCLFIPFGAELRAVEGDATAPAKSAASIQAQPFKEGEQVAFVGDSITHSGFYHDYVYLYYATRFPGRKISFYNCGISGDTAAGALRRVQGDVLRHKPTVATIMLGMNDVSRGLYDEGNSALDLPKKREAALQSHFENMRKLVERLSSDHVKLIFMTPSLYDQTAKLERLNSPGVNDALVLCGENARKLAAEFKGQVIDFNEPMAGINKALQQADPTATIIGADRIHPGEKGHLIMAYLFLKAQNAPQFVADMTIDAKGRTEIQFTEHEKALPFPVPLAAVPALKLVPFMEELNQERLRVTDLPEGTYDLLIDGEKVASFTAAEFSKGVNLATLNNTPQMKQAQEVAKLDSKRHETAKRLRTIDYVEWKMGREIGDPTEFDWIAAVEKMNADPKITGWPKDRVADYAKLKPQQAALLKEHDDAIEAIRREGQPKEHRFIVRATDTK